MRIFFFSFKQIFEKLCLLCGFDSIPLVCYLRSFGYQCFPQYLYFHLFLFYFSRHQAIKLRKQQGKMNDSLNGLYFLFPQSHYLTPLFHSIYVKVLNEVIDFLPPAQPVFPTFLFLQFMLIINSHELSPYDWKISIHLP